MSKGFAEEAGRPSNLPEALAGSGMRWRRVRVGSYRLQYWDGSAWLGPLQAWTIKLEDGEWVLRDDRGRERGRTLSLDDCKALRKES